MIYKIDNFLKETKHFHKNNIKEVLQKEFPYININQNGAILNIYEGNNSKVNIEYNLFTQSHKVNFEMRF